jgi:hypothetical protein
MRRNSQLFCQAESAKRRSFGLGARGDTPATVAASSAVRPPSRRVTRAGRRANLTAALAAGAGARKVERMGASVTRMSRPLRSPGAAAGSGSLTGAPAGRGRAFA